MSWAWGKRIVELFPYHWDRITLIEHDRGVATKMYADATIQVIRLEAELKEAAESRVRAEDHARFLQTQLTTTQSQLDSITSKLLATHERTTDFLALAASGGHRSIHANPPTVDSKPTPADDPSHQPITTGRMRASDARAVMSKLSVADDVRRQAEIRKHAEMLRQQAAARQEMVSENEDEPVVQIRQRQMSDEERKAAGDIADQIERELMREEVG
jgi:hypothetical protein